MCIANCYLTAPDLVMDFSVEFLTQNATRGIYIVTWTAPLPSNGSYYQRLEYYFSSAYNIGPQYSGSVNLTLDQTENQYNISDALYFTNYTFTITTINMKYNISNGLIEITDQSLRAGIFCKCLKIYVFTLTINIVVLVLLFFDFL